MDLHREYLNFKESRYGQLVTRNIQNNINNNKNRLVDADLSDIKFIQGQIRGLQTALSELEITADGIKDDIMDIGDENLL